MCVVRDEECAAATVGQKRPPGETTDSTRINRHNQRLENHNGWTIVLFIYCDTFYSRVIQEQQQ